MIVMVIGWKFLQSSFLHIPNTLTSNPTWPQCLRKLVKFNIKRWLFFFVWSHKNTRYNGIKSNECKWIITHSRHYTLYLFSRRFSSGSGLPTCYPPGQRTRVASSQLSWFGFLGGNKFHQLDKQPLCVVLLPLWTQGLLSLWRKSGWKVGHIKAMIKLTIMYTTHRVVETYWGIKSVYGVPQPGLLHSGSPCQNLWMFARIPPRHIHHLQHTNTSKGIIHQEEILHCINT